MTAQEQGRTAGHCGRKVTAYPRGVFGGRYSEAAHIRPVGRPHNGPDTLDNILCLCPNHHVLFDRGSIWIDERSVVQPLGTPLRVVAVHVVGATNTEYHRTRIYKA